MADFGGSNTPVDIKDLWRTPAELFAALNEEFNFVGDVAASDENNLHECYLTSEDDALSLDWRGLFSPGYLFCNPPYSDITPWVNKSQEAVKGGIGVVMLVPADTSVGWFRIALTDVSEIRFITGGRISFVRADTCQVVNGNNKGSMLLVWHPARRVAGITKYIDRDELIQRGKVFLEQKEMCGVAV
ncbi:phage N-6-adenine-methyltransferase [Enterobacteriaceae bacterium YMB-R22]|uniref:DNA N-6-adenine-methyltransferase (Dam) n=1 Tax=Mixta intestinalis TaxID=1615494 RepID=A0A6P1PXM0_9GAMM|nr:MULTISPECIES: phage N-6-adenine-methyltransferase [Enterobacterales]MBV4413317.1 phage N-6-adenine-methyltransferase [Tenebrionicola larvae]QHM70697.1 hypothetical protein C7M51_00975 [Mixta intestinalis]